MLKSLIQSLCRKFGYDIRKIPSSTFPVNPFDAQQRLIMPLEIDSPTIFDLGANKGQTAINYRSRFPQAHIYCFEPFPDTVRELRSRIGHDPLITVVPSAVADKPGRRQFYVNAYDATNSLLPRTSGARRYYPIHAGPVSTIEVDVTTIDTFVQQEGCERVDILKLDLQGGELMALNGAKETLRIKDVSLIYTEIMFVPHYEGYTQFHELLAYLNERGFNLFDIYNLVRATNGQLKYGDALFVNHRVREQVIDTFPEEP